MTISSKKNHPNMALVRTQLGIDDTDLSPALIRAICKIERSTFKGLVESTLSYIRYVEYDECKAGGRATLLNYLIHQHTFSQTEGHMGRCASRKAMAEFILASRESVSRFYESLSIDPSPAFHWAEAEIQQTEIIAKLAGGLAQ